MTLLSPQDRIAPVGDLRTAVVASRRQFLGATLSSLAAMGWFVLAAAGWTFDSLWLYSESTPLGERGYVPGPLFAVAAVLILVASPARVVPRRIGGSRVRALAAGPTFARKVRRELHGSVLYNARRLGWSVIALAVLWVATGAFYYAQFNDVWSDPDVTVREGARIAVALVAAGLVSVVLLIPSPRPRRIRVDDEGSFFPAESHQPEPGQPAPPMATASLSPPAQPAPVGPAPTGRGRVMLAALVASVLTVVALTGAVAFVALRGGEAGQPGDLVDKFDQAGVLCLDYDVITDSRSVKTLGCRTDDVQILTITTYGDRPSSEEWLREACSVADGTDPRLSRGYYLLGSDFVIDMHQLKPPDFVRPTPLDRTSKRLARVLGAERVPYNCLRD